MDGYAIVGCGIDVGLFRPLDSIWLILLQKQKHLQPYPPLLLLEFPMKCLGGKSSSRSWMKTILSFEWQKAQMQ